MKALVYDGAGDVSVSEEREGLQPVVKPAA
ncbi:MAG: hypothetical protein JWQ18_490 [Conexibacter sp.]|nr:hypothetical protein [Conexibacter sp.]